MSEFFLHRKWGQAPGTEPVPVFYPFSRELKKSPHPDPLPVRPGRGDVRAHSCTVILDDSDQPVLVSLDVEYDAVSNERFTRGSLTE